MRGGTENCSTKSQSTGTAEVTVLGGTWYFVLGWLRGTVVRTLVFDHRTFLSHRRPAADG